MNRQAVWVAASCLAAISFSPIRGDEVVLADFESGYGDWVAAGEAFGVEPAAGPLGGQMTVGGFSGERLVNSFHDGDQTTGTLLSPPFEIARDFVSFLLGGGGHPGEIGAELLIDDEPVRTATGRDSEQLQWRSWDVREFRGRTARVRLFDRATGGWGHVLFDQLTLTDESRERPIVGRLEHYRQTPSYYRERYRPQYHFTPEIHWMNDPNGLVFFDGEYHLFYQHNPHAIEWGHMSWGHAVSGDLLHWKHLPIALHDEYGAMCFSGSAVADHANTSGFGTGDAPPLVAIYTGHGHGRQTQDLAYSNDQGRTWTKYAGNPVLDLALADFRDPKVFWHESTGRWVMVVSLAADRRVQFYGSPNLREWTLLSEFGPAGTPNKPNWECPDLFELPIENAAGETAWVLEADMGGGSIAGGSGGEYFVGDFDGERFTPISTESQWVDYGRDFYAPVSWNDVPDGRRLWIGWMNNWETALNPTYPWRSAMSIPRELTLRRDDDERIVLCQRPVRELQSLRRTSVEVDPTTLDDESKPLAVRGQQLELFVEFEPGSAERFGIRVLKSGDQFTEIGCDAAAGAVYVDRTASGDVAWHAAFAGRHVGPLAAEEDGRVQLHVLVDSCSVEVFVGDGRTVLTDLVFPKSGADAVELFAVGGDCRVTRCEAHRLGSVWHEPTEPAVGAPRPSR